MKVRESKVLHVEKYSYTKESRRDIKIRNYQPNDEINVINLWKECGLVVPWNNPKTDIERKCSDSPEMFFIGELNNELVASCMAGYDGHRGWIYFIAVKKIYQKQGVASKMVEHAESALVELGCPKVELMVRNSNDDVISFYQKNEYRREPIVVLSKRLIEDEPHEYE